MERPVHESPAAARSAGEGDAVNPDATIEALRREVEEKSKRIDKLKKYIGNLEADGDRLNRELTLANSYREALDLDIIGIPIMMVSRDFELLKANRLFCDISGVDPDTLRHKPKCSDALRCDTFRQGRCIVRDAYDAKAPVRGHRCRYVNPAGRKFQFTADASPIMDLASGAILGGIEVFSQVEEDTRSQYLLFSVDGKEMGARTDTLREIISQTDVHPFPDMPAHVTGVINVRGQILPVVDLKTSLGLVNDTAGVRQCIAVFASPEGTTPGAFGLVLDDIREIVTLNRSDIEAAPDLGLATAGSRVQGIARIRGQSRVVIDVATLVCGRGHAPAETIAHINP